MRLLAAACLGAALAAPAADLDLKLRLQSTLLRLERERDGAATQLKAAEAAVARNQDLVARAAGASRETQTAAAMALDLSRQNLGQRQRRLAQANASVEALQRVLAHPRFDSADIQAIPLAVEGTVTVRTRDGRKMNLGPHHPWLEPGEQVVTGKDGKVTLALGPAEGTLQIGPDSAVAWAAETLGQTIELAIGQINLWIHKVQHSKFGKHYEARTPYAIAAVRGTRFELRVEPDGATLCTVTEGTVDVSDREGRVTRPVPASHRIRIPKGHLPGQPLPEPERVDVAQLPTPEARP